MDINIVLSFSGDGGVENMAINLMQGFSDLGHKVTLFRIKNRGRFAKQIPGQVNIIQLPSKHTFLNLTYMIKLFKTHPLKSILVMKERAGLMCLIAKIISGSNIKVYIRFGTHIKRSLMEKKLPGIYVKTRLFVLKKMLPKADGIIGVSKGVLDDILSICPEIKNKSHVIKNPVITKDLKYLASEPVGDNWLNNNRNVPVIIGMGRLTYQKGFDVLIRAIGLVLKDFPVRLIILGDGHKKNELQGLTKHLHIQDYIKFLGFKKNPYPYLKNADLFVLSSRWEGSPNALTEALALGTPCIATNCESGPLEILRGGELGPLVPVGDHITLARKIIEVLKSPPKKEDLIQGVLDYDYLISAKGYLRLLAN